MMTPLVHLTLPPFGVYSPESHFAPLVFMLEGLVKVNEHHINQSFRRAKAGLGSPIPPLFSTGIRYQEDPPGKENWRDIYAILQHIANGAKGIDCDQIVCWRVAELRCAGIDAEPVIKWQHLTREIAIKLGFKPQFVPNEGLWLVHCCVRFPDGSIEDTSKLLGMGGSFTSKA